MGNGDVAGRGWLFAGALSGGLGVALGAFGAHALRGTVATDLMAVWDTASRYHLVHAVALLAVAWAAGRLPGRAVSVSGWGFAVGTVVFSGTLYAMTVTGARWLGAITPVGGVLFLVGWFALAWAALRSRP